MRQDSHRPDLPEIRPRALLDRLPDAVFALDREWRFTYVNRRAGEFLQRAPGELFGRDIWKVFPHATASAFSRELLRSMRERAESTFEVRSPVLQDHWLEVRVEPFEGGLVSHVRDVSERKHIEGRLRARAEWLRMVIENTSDVIHMIDMEGTIRYINSTVERVLGYDSEELVGRPAAEFVHPEDLPTGETAMAEALEARDGAAVGVEMRLRHRDGSWRTLETRGRAFRDASGRPRIVIISQDITERKHAEERERFLLRTSQVLASSLDYEETLQRVAQLAVPTLADWCVVDVVREDGSIERLAAAHCDAETQALVDALRRFPPDPAKREGVPEALRTGEPRLDPDMPDALVEEIARDEEHLRILRELGVKSGIIVPLRARERTLGAITLVISRAGRHYAEEDLRFARLLAQRAGIAIDNAGLYREAMEAVRARDEVVSYVSHDLKNPLNVIVSAADLVKMGTGDEKMKKYADMIRRASRHMTSLIEDLLAIAKLEAGRFRIEREPCDASSLIEEAVALTRLSAEAEGLRLECEVSAGVPPISADPERLLRVLSNLVGNAIKYTPEGGRIALRAERRGEDVLFSVQDTGPGIPLRQLPHVFDRFWQARRTHRAGTGLGLAIVKGIIDAHKGRIWVESEVGRGATFCFTLPAAGPADEGA